MYLEIPPIPEMVKLDASSISKEHAKPRMSSRHSKHARLLMSIMDAFGREELSDEVYLNGHLGYGQFVVRLNCFMAN